MRRLLVPITLLCLTAAACGGGDKKSDEASKGSDDTTTTTTAPSAESTTTAPGAAGAPTATGTGKGATAPAGSGSGAGSAGGATTTTAKSSSGSSTSGGSFAAPGTYAYNRTGKMTTSFGERSLDGPVSLKVDPPANSEQRSVQTASDSTSEQILRLIPEGAYFTYLKQSQSGLSKEFRPNPPVLAVPASAPVGRTWSWSVTSTDGATKLDASFRVDRTETLTIGGEQVQTIVLAIVLKTSGDIELTTNQTNWVSPSKGLSVKVDETSNGRAGSVTFSSQSSTVLTSTKPS